MSKSFAFLQFGCASIFLFLWICVGHSVKQDLDSTKYFKERFLKKRCNLDEMCCICITLCYICNKWYVLLKPTFPKQRSLKYFLFQGSCTELLWTIQIHRKKQVGTSQVSLKQWCKVEIQEPRQHCLLSKLFQMRSIGLATALF